MCEEDITSFQGSKRRLRLPRSSAPLSDDTEALLRASAEHTEID
jgi:hypothetical protein